MGWDRDEAIGWNEHPVEPTKKLSERNEEFFLSRKPDAEYICRNISLQIESALTERVAYIRENAEQQIFRDLAKLS